MINYTDYTPKTSAMQCIIPNYCVFFVIFFENFLLFINLCSVFNKRH